MKNLALDIVAVVSLTIVLAEIYFFVWLFGG